MNTIMSIKRSARNVTCLAFIGVYAFLSPHVNAQKSTEGEAVDLLIDETQIDRQGQAPRSFAPMIEQVSESVVSVHTARVVKVFNSGRSSSPEEEMLRRFFGRPSPRQEAPRDEDMKEQRIPQGVGSGVIVREDGYILTNNHVVTGSGDDVADEVLVRLNDGRELQATVLGRDPKTDIAVLKIEAEGLPIMKLADSEYVSVGDIVFAIGNPMGVGQTVTQGIVSATGRSIGIYGREGYENFIQTDASINPGNSGGALVDIEGRLIGINSAILSQSGGNIGIGFAIPTNLAAAITAQLTEYGEVRRGFLGVQINDLTPDMAEAFNLNSTNGALIENVDDGTPAKNAGLQVGDVIVEVDGREIKGANQLKIRIGQIRPDSEIDLVYMRDGKRRETKIKVGDQEEMRMLAGSNLIEGVNVKPLDDEARSRFGISDEINGLLISEVDPSSSYARYLRDGMVILEINGAAVSSVKQARDFLRVGVNRLYVFDRGNLGFVAIRIR